MKKLIVLLVVLGLSMPAMAAYMGTESNPLMVDVTHGTSSQSARAGYQNWAVANDWTSPVNCTFNNPEAEDPWEIPIGSLEAFKTAVTPNNNGGARARNGGMAFVAGTGEYNQTGKGLGMNYLKLTVTGLAPDTAYRVVVWSYEARNVWSMRTDNPDSKFGVWSTLDPITWLTNNGYGPGGENTTCTLGGYGPKFSIDNPVATTDSNMPAAMQALALGDAQGARFSLMAPLSDGGNHIGQQNDYCAKILDVMTTSGGSLALYGWIDMTDWAGSAHMPIHGLVIIPEPMTIALLGLGGLALIRRKRA